MKVYEARRAYDKWVYRWMVESESEPGKRYIVGQDRDGSYGCSCPGWIFGHSRPGFINENHKHIAWVIAAGGKSLNGVLTLKDAVISRLAGDDNGSRS